LARILWRNSPWSIISSSSSRPISDWILAIIYPTSRLAIPLVETRKFQLFASLTFDFIWLSRNKLIHDALQPDSRKAILQLKSNMDSYLLAWRDVALPSLWLPPQIGCLKEILMWLSEIILRWQLWLSVILQEISF
jgi:hypothetical protein